jgi:hypothetical protein
MSTQPTITRTKTLHEGPEDDDSEGFFSKSWLMTLTITETREGPQEDDDEYTQNLGAW